MKQVQKNILSVAGVIASIIGVAGAIPTISKNQIALSVLFIILLIGGLVLLAISFGE
jgi:hypothetical protein